MGQSQTWFMYARDKNDRWCDEPLYNTIIKADNINHHMGRFKHRVYEYALGELDIGKLYLYQGWSRLIKCYIDEDTFKIKFQTKEAKLAWESCRRSQKGKVFDTQFTPIAIKDDWVLYFKRNTQVLSD